MVVRDDAYGRERTASSVQGGLKGGDALLQAANAGDEKMEDEEGDQRQEFEQEHHFDVELERIMIMLKAFVCVEKAYGPEEEKRKDRGDERFICIPYSHGSRISLLYNS